ncbi:MAG: S24/S26 family peptidase [Clostridiales bacterium]|nr:S24/S26 family peptidase [Clostridiales bacterium]
MKDDLSLKVLEAMKKSNSKLLLTIAGTSMLPVIGDGDSVYFQKPPRYRLGDILVYERSSGTVITHRLLYKTTKHLYIKGDSTVAIDKVAYPSVLGAVYKVKKTDRNITISRGFYLLPVILSSYHMHRIWKRTGSFKKAYESWFFRNLESLLVKRFNLG